MAAASVKVVLCHVSGLLGVQVVQGREALPVPAPRCSPSRPTT